MNTNPQTLVVSMPIYNAKKTLEAAVESVLNQQYKNIKLIMTDDFSEDGSLEIAKQYLKDPRVVLLSNSENRGAYYCRNAGLSYMSNKTWGYFTTHDSDDISFNHRYKSLIKQIKKTNTVAIQDGFRRIDYFTGDFIKQNITVAHAVFKKEVFDKIGYFEPVRCGADWEYWKRLEAFCKNTSWEVLATSEIMGESFIHGANITAIIPEGSKERVLYMKQSRRRIQSRLVNKNPYQSFNLEKITQEVRS